MRDDGRAKGLQTVRLGDLGSFRRGQGGTKADERPDGAPCVRYGDLYTEHDAVIRGFSKFIARESISRYTPLLCGDVVLAASGETHEEIGKGAVYCGKDVAYAGGDTIIFRPGNAVHPLFIGYAVNARDAELFKARYGQGSSVIHISAAHLGELPLVLLPLPEQRCIAKILDTVDEAIRKTAQVIGKLQQMKQGLLQDLLTRGLDDDGELRDPDRHPEQFKDSPLGRIPREWEVGSLRSFYSEPHRNGLYKPNSYHGRGPLMIQMGGIFKGLDADFSGAIRVQVSPIEVRTYGLRQGDLLFARRSLVLEGAGKCSLVRSLPEPATFESSIVRVHVDQQRLRPEFVALYLDSSGSYLQRRKCIRQVAVSGVSGADISAFPVPCPSLGEQDGIVARHRTLCSRLGEEKTELDKVHTLKHGLMDDLLTGRVRVSVPEEAAA